MQELRTMNISGAAHNKKILRIELNAIGLNHPKWPHNQHRRKPLILVVNYIERRDSIAERAEPNTPQRQSDC
jgi:hypothetical protein